jgi:profilin-like protein
MAEDEAWSETCREWLIDEGYCCAGALAGKSDCQFYAAAAGPDVDKWQYIYKEPRQEEITAEDGVKMNKVDVDETNILWEIITNGVKGNYPSGIWFGGKKYTLTREQEIDVEGNEVKSYFGARPKGGFCIACSAQSIVLGFNDEEKGQMGGNCQKAVLAMVKYLIENSS